MASILDSTGFSTCGNSILNFSSCAKQQTEFYYCLFGGRFYSIRDFPSLQMMLLWWVSHYLWIKLDLKLSNLLGESVFPAKIKRETKIRHYSNISRTLFLIQLTRFFHDFQLTQLQPIDQTYEKINEIRTWQDSAEK